MMFFPMEAKTHNQSIACLFSKDGRQISGHVNAESFSAINLHLVECLYYVHSINLYTKFRLIMAV